MEILSSTDTAAAVLESLWISVPLQQQSISLISKMGRQEQLPVSKLRRALEAAT